MKLLGFFILAATAVLCNAMIHGTPTDNAPYSASVRTSNPVFGTSRLGGGAVISQRHILTSSSMVLGYTHFTVSWGPDRNETGFSTMEATANIEPFMTYNNDLGIIRTTINIVFSSRVHPIQLPRYAPRENEQGMIVGFGGPPFAPAGRYFAAFPRVTTQTRCQARWPLANRALNFCAEDERVRSDFCARNTGSALTMLSRGVEVVVGIALEAHCLTTGESQPSLYANVLAHRAWILRTTEFKMSQLSSYLI